MNIARLVLWLPLGILIGTPTVAQGTPLCFAIDQPSGNDNFGSRSTGQTFTPGVGVTPGLGTNNVLPLVEVTMYQGNSGATSPSATTYLNIYDGDPNAGGMFIGSSTNAVDTNTPSFRTPMVWTFNLLPVATTTEYWAIMSSTITAGALDVEVSLETELRNGPPGPNVYTGGAGLIANIVQHPASVDAKFQILFSLAAPASFTTFGSGCAGTGGVPSISTGPGSVPRIGQPFTVECANLPPAASSAFSVLGFSRLIPAVDLTLIGLAGCSLYVAVDITLAQPVLAGRASITVTIPASSVWVGNSLFYQWVVVDPGSTALGLILSDAGQATVGC